MITNGMHHPYLSKLLTAPSYNSDNPMQASWNEYDFEIAKSSKQGNVPDLLHSAEKLLKISYVVKFILNALASEPVSILHR
jgi:hypothetical protein